MTDSGRGILVSCDRRKGFPLNGRRPASLSTVRWSALLVASALALPGLATAGRVASATAGQTVTVSAAGPVRAVTPTLFGFSGVDTSGPPWNAPAFDRVLASFAPGVLRYPGGTAANYWSWQTGWFQPGRWPSEPKNRVNDRLPIFAVGLGASGGVPMYDLNALTYHGEVATNAENIPMLNDQLRFLRAAAARGLPVTMVELGNEFYLNGVRSSGPHVGEYEERFPTPVDYARQMNVWIAAIHKAFPDAQIAAVGTDTNDIRAISKRRLAWNAGVVPHLRGANAITIHENLRFYDAKATPSTVLAFPYLHLQKLENSNLRMFARYHLPVWITAFGLEDLSKGHVFQGTWLNGLFVGEQALLFLGLPAVQHLMLDTSIGNDKAAIFSGAEGFGSGGPPTVPLALTAEGTTLAVIQAALHRATSAQPAAFSPAPELGKTGAPALTGDVLTTSAGPELLVENLSRKAITLSLSAMFPAGFTATQVTAPSVTERVTGPTSTTTSTSTGSADLTIEPYALADITTGQI
jgi:hypothetical protein